MNLHAPLNLHAAPPAGESLRELLLACHHRIRHFARLAFTLGVRLDLPPQEVRAVALSTAQYFRVGLPAHAADEDESVFPRLLGRWAALDAVLGQLRVQHREHEPEVRQLVTLLEAVASQPTDAALLRALRDHAVRVETTLEAHLRLEELNVFPALASLGDQARVVAELRARRRPPVSS